MTISRWCALVAVMWMLNVSSAEAQCTYSVSPTSFSVDSTSSTRTLSIVSGTLCSWTATTSETWITVSGGAAGSGIGSVTFVIASNSTGSSRTGTLIVAGQTVTITQGTGSCASSVSPTSFAVDASATSRTVSVTIGTLCPWSATTTATWITVTNASGTGVGSVTFSIAANAGGARSGVLSVAGQSVTVNQAAGSGSGVPAPPTNLRIISGGSSQ